MFLVSASLFCLALWLASRDERRRRFWLTAAAVTFAAQALTLSRTGWIMAAVGVCYWRSSALVGRQTAPFGGAWRGRAGLGSASPACRRNVASSSDHGLRTERARGQRLVQEVAGDGCASPWSPPSGGQSQESVRPVLASLWLLPDPGTVLDNNYIFLADGYGLVTLAAFLVVGLSVVALFFRLRRATTLAVLPAVVLANLVALYFVAFITQQQVFFWVLVGACGALAQLFPRRSASGP